MDISREQRLWNNGWLWISILITSIGVLFFMISDIPGLSGSIYAG